MQKGFAEITRQLVTTIVRLDSNTARLDSIEPRLDSIESRLDSVEEKVDSLTQDVGELKKNQPLYAHEIINAIGNYFDVVEARHERRFTRIEQWVGISL